MDGSAAVGLASNVSLTETGVIICLILLAVWLAYHIRADRTDRRRAYERDEQMEDRLTTKMESIRVELRKDHNDLSAKVDRLAEGQAELRGKIETLGGK